MPSTAVVRQKAIPVSNASPSGKFRLEPAPAVAPGMMRVHIVSQDHTDGKVKKTWLRDSVIEIDEYTAKRMIENLKCAYPTSEPINEILVEYKGK